MSTLIFLLTVLALFSTLIALPIVLFQRRLDLARIIGGGMLAWLIIYTALLFGFAWFSPQTILNQGQEECFDDMCFSVTQARFAAATQGSELIVTLQLRNAALRTAEKPDHPAAYLVDQQGKTYQPSSTGQQPVWDQQLLSGETQQRTLIFPISAMSSSPFLVVTEGSFPTPLIIGDNNSPFHRKTEFRLFAM